MKTISRTALAAAALILISAVALDAQQIATTPALPYPELSLPPGAVLGGPQISTDLSVPGFSSMPGAAYTIYLDFGGFSFSGNWGNNAFYVPGVQSAFDNASGAFNAGELAAIKQTWSAIAAAYAPFNVNVTTVDPAVAAGQAGSDLTRQNYYDSQPRMMHTVEGGNGSWLSGAGGVSYVGVTASAFPGSNGLHTNFLFANEAPFLLGFTSTGASHENGHGFGLSHQSDYTPGGSKTNEYDYPTGGPMAPIMGAAYYTQRGLWANVVANNGVGATQNDARTIANNAGMGGFVNDGIGHTLGAPTALPLNGTAVNFNNTQGVIVPSNAVTPDTSNYTSDFWSFHTSGGTVSITANSGRESITPGTPDPGATLGTKLEILKPDGTVLAVSDTTVNSVNETLNGGGSTAHISGVALTQLSQTLTLLNVPAGNYIVEVLSAGNVHASYDSFQPRDFYNMGPYFLTGSIPQVPEPGTFVLSLCGLVGFAALSVRRRPARPGAA